MPDVGDWSATDLCDYDDVIAAYANALELTDETVEANQQADLTARIVEAKAKIGRKLDLTLKDYYSANLGKYSASEDLKDKISNLTILKDACVALTLAYLFRDAVNIEGDFNDTRRKYWEGQFAEEYKIASSLLRFDKDDDGDISDSELATTIGANRFTRV